MAIVIRRGAYADFVPSKLQPGEFADVQSGDPNTTDGKALYICLASGNVVRIASSSEIDAIMTDVDLHLATWSGNLAPEYSSSSGYSVGDFAVHENVLYKCRTNIPAGGEAWNASHWTQTTIMDLVPDIDTTLTISGDTADAKVTGDKLNEINNHFSDIDGLTVATWQPGIRTCDVVGEIIGEVTFATGDYVHAIIPCTVNDIVTINVRGAGTGRAWAYLDSEYRVLQCGTSNTLYTDYELTTPPANTAYVLLNNRTGSDYLPTGYYGYVGARLTKTRLDLNERLIGENIDKIFDDLYTQSQGSVNWSQGGLTIQGDATGSDIRLRTRYVETHIPYKVHVPSGLKVRIAFYTPNTAVNPHTFQFWGDWKTSDFSLYENYEYAWRAMAGKVSDANIVPSEASGITFIGIRPTAYATEEYVGDSISDVQESIDSVQESVYSVQETINESLYFKASINITNNYQHYWNVETSKAVYTEISAQFYASEPIPVSEGEVYTLTARQGTTDKARIWVVVNDSYDVIAMCENFNGTDVHTVTFSIPSGGTKLLLTKQQTSSVQTLYKNTSALDVLTKNLKGKYLSLLGDSISSYRGTIPEGNDVYYTGSNAGVSSPDQMWWKILCDKTGMIPLIINGWSGSGITQLEDSAHVNKVPMSSDTRCAQLDDGVNTPDIVLIAGGVNDYSYAQSAQSEPLDWDGKTAPVISNSFTEAYACMIKKIQTNYPNAIVVALSTWFTMRGDDNGYTLTHTVGNHVYTQQDYNDKIRYVAEQMHIPYIDVSNIGFNRNNFNPTYAQDSNIIPTHPNKNGQYEMGNAIAHKLINLVAMKLLV